MQQFLECPLPSSYYREFSKADDFTLTWLFLLVLPQCLLLIEYSVSEAGCLAQGSFSLFKTFQLKEKQTIACFLSHEQSVFN